MMQWFTTVNLTSFDTLNICLQPQIQRHRFCKLLPRHAYVHMLPPLVRTKSQSQQGKLTSDTLLVSSDVIIGSQVYLTTSLSWAKLSRVSMSAFLSLLSKFSSIFILVSISSLHLFFSYLWSHLQFFDCFFYWVDINQSFFYHEEN